MNRSTKWIASMFVVLVGVAIFVEWRAEYQAKSFCGRFGPDSSFADAQRGASSEGETRYRRVTSDEVSIAYIGVSSFSRHACIINAGGTKVISARYVYID